MMKRKIIIPLLLILLLPACRKNSTESYTLKFYGDAREDIGYSVAIASDGYIIGGQMDLIARKNGFLIDSLSNKEMAIIKTDWNGNVKWKVTAGGKYDDMGSKIYQLSDGSIICVGTLTDTVLVTRKKQVFAMKISSAGQIVWKKAYGGAGNQIGKDIAESGTGFLILGTTDAPSLSGADSTGNIAGHTDLLILSISDNGDFIESHPAGFSGNDEATAIKQDLDGRFIILGTTDREIQGSGMELNNLFVVRLREDGIQIGHNVIGTTDDEYASGLQILHDGYLIAGTVKESPTSNKAYIVKLKKDIFHDPVEFIQKFSIGNYSTIVNAISPYPGGDFLVGGYIDANPGLRMLVFEIGSDGAPVNGKTMIKGNTADQIVNDMVAGDDGYIIAVGRNTYEVNSMISFLKFRF
jgi:hypothetical protein